MKIIEDDHKLSCEPKKFNLIIAFFLGFKRM